jgi:hypothetical protein
MLDVGVQPVGNRFVRRQGDAEALFPLSFNLCRECGMIQLAELVPAEELRPRFDWITYNEPEDHLDAMVEMLIQLPGISAEARCLGVSFKDDTTLRRFEKKGFTHTGRIDPAEDLGISDKGAGAETLQGRITPERMRKVAASRGRAGMVVIRHVLEHAYDLRAFLDGLKELVAPNGYVVIEVPDCSRAIERCDYTTLWEEHVVYFSPPTLRRCLEEAGFSITGFVAYPYAFEDSLVCVAQVRKGAVPAHKEDVGKALADAQHFARMFKGYGVRVRSFLEEYRRKNGKVAMFGAGHLACVYINFFGLKDLVECVVDDNANKKGLFMPGSQLPILGSQALADQGITLCLLTLNPMGEDKVVARNSAFVQNGGRFASIFPASRLALKF